MIKTLRRKFIAIAMLSVVIVLALLIGTIDILNYYEVVQNVRSEMSLLKMYQGDFRDDRDDVIEDGGRFAGYGRLPEEFNEDVRRGRISREAPFSLRFFTVTYAGDGTMTALNLSQIASVFEADAKEIAAQVRAGQGTEGFYEDYYYAVIEEDVDGSPGQKYIFLDCSENLASFRRFRNISLAVSLVGIALVFVLVVFLSKIVMRPVAESYEKQKHFITDASHEIKTPLAIIEANTEVLEMTEGENEWLKSIRHQISRLSGLTEKLVFLSRMDEEGTRLEMLEFSLSDALTEVAESFLPVATARNRRLDIRMAEGIVMQGDRDKLSQMLSLLLDNAMKYSNEGGVVSASLALTAKGKKEIKVYNTLEEIAPGRHDELFERFYRADASRSSETGGSGIGLSVVKAIALAHKGRVSCESRDGASIEFTILLP